MKKKNNEEILKIAKDILDNGEIIIYSDKMKSGKMLEEFSKYCVAHQDERFMQALRNFLKVGFVLTARDYNYNEREYIGIKDTFND